MTRIVVALSDVGEGIEDAIILEWKVGAGDTVHINQTLLEIETVKAVVEVPAPCDGVVVSLEAAEGDTVEVGAALAIVADSSVDVPQSAAPDTNPPVVQSDSQTTQSGLLAKPAVRRAAKELGIDLVDVAGTGPNGQVIEQDLLDHHVRSLPPAQATPAQSAVKVDPGTTLVPVSAVRRATAKAVTASYFSAPHATVFLEADATATVEFVRAIRSQQRFNFPDITALAVVAAAVVRAATEVPEINSVWDGLSDNITQHDSVNLGIAVATDRGLLVPTIADAQQLSVTELATALSDKVGRARAGRSAPEEFRGGTITVSNVGSLGIDTATPIVNTGESAIVCVGAVKKRPWVVDDVLQVRSTVPLSLSFDHRLIDGDSAARALGIIAEVLQNPLWVLPIDLQTGRSRL